MSPFRPNPSLPHAPMTPKWVVTDPDEAEIRRLGHELGVTALTARLILNRGYGTLDRARAYLESPLSALPSPALMKGMDAAVRRILNAVQRRERICIFGDYDVDGITSTTLLAEFFDGVGVPPFWFVPNRFTHGYGLTGKAITELRERVGPIDLLITVDCGTRSIGEIDALMRSGTDVIVTDHHLPGSELPRAVALLNPKQPGCMFPFSELAGVGVTFYLAAGVRKALIEVGHPFPSGAAPDLKQFLDLVAIGTICDIMPLTSVNRILTRAGLLRLTRSHRPGINALKSVAGIPLDRPITQSDVGYKVGPRLNASGRMEDAGLGVSCLLERDPTRAEALADRLNRCNLERRELEQTILDGALARIPTADQEGVALDDPEWHSGIIGIVASKLVTCANRPVILFAHQGDLLKGSARSTDAIHITEIFNEIHRREPGLMLSFGGHAKAAGLTIPKDRLEEFRVHFNRILTELSFSASIAPIERVDAWVNPRELPGNFVQEFERMEPFGNGNPPVRLAYNIPPGTPLRVLKEKHIRLDIPHPELGRLSMIGFNVAHSILPSALPLSVLYQPGFNYYNGSVSFQLSIDAWQHA